MRPGKTAKQQRIERAAARASQRTPQERLAELDRRLGRGQGAKKERARLQALAARQGQAAGAK